MNQKRLNSEKKSLKIVKNHENVKNLKSKTFPLNLKYPKTHPKYAFAEIANLELYRKVRKTIFRVNFGLLKIQSKILGVQLFCNF